MSDPIPFPTKQYDQGPAVVINEEIIRWLEKKHANSSNAEMNKRSTNVLLAVTQRFRPQMTKEERAAWDTALHMQVITKEREELADKRGLRIREVVDKK